MEKFMELSAEGRAEVRERYPKVRFPRPVMEPLWYGRRNQRRIDGKLAIIDAETETVFGICSDEYKIVHYEDIISMVERSMDPLKASYGEITVCPHVLSDGGKLRLSIKMEGQQVKIGTVDSIIPKVEVHSSYDLAWKLVGRFGMWMLRCTNGAGIWKTAQSFARRHLQSLELESLADTISEGLGVFHAQKELWGKWAETKVSAVAYKTIWENLPFSSAEKEKIEALPETGTNLLLPKALEANDLNLWQFNSVLTQFATHQVKSDLRRIELEPVIAKVMDQAFDNIKLH